MQFFLIFGNIFTAFDISLAFADIL